MNGRFGEAAQRFAERRRREDEAPRLITVVPALERLELTFREVRAVGDVAETTHTRRVVVDRAPALFEILCLDSSCKDGGHDLTAVILQALRGRKENFEGEDVCYGRVGTAECGRVLRFVARAAYRPLGAG